MSIYKCVTEIVALLFRGVFGGLLTSVVKL